MWTAADAIHARYARSLELARALDAATVARGVEQAFFVSPVDPPSLPTIRDLTAADLLEAWRLVAADIRSGRAPELLSLYVHVPYCHRRCTYCIFASAEYRLADSDVYLAGLQAEIELLAPALEGLRFITCYLGGGTPTVLGEGQLASLLSLLAGAFARRPGGQWAFECNPQSVTRAKAELFAAHGFNHVNVGVQSLDPVVLERANRGYQDDSLLAEALGVLAGCRFHLNVDLLHGLPGERPDGFADGLRKVVDLGPHRITIYALSPATPLQVGPVVSLERLAEQVESIPQAAGYRRTALDSTCLEFARPDSDSLLYTEARQAGSRVNYDDAMDEPLSLLGLGPAARSNLPGRMGYLRLPDKLGLEGTIARGRPLDMGFERGRYVSKHLPSERGLDAAAYRVRFGAALADHFGAALASLEQMDLLRLEGDRYQHVSSDPAVRFAVELTLVDDGFIDAAFRQLEQDRGGGPGQGADEAIGVELGAAGIRLPLDLDHHRPGQDAYHHYGAWVCRVPPDLLQGSKTLDHRQETLLDAFRSLFDRVVQVDAPTSLVDLQRGLIRRSGRAKTRLRDRASARLCGLEIRPWPRQDAS